MDRKAWFAAVHQNHKELDMTEWLVNQTELTGRNKVDWFCTQEGRGNGLG